MHDVAILGSGPAGLTAAIYAARANLSTLVFTGDALGGQIATTYDVENYPGFEEITGPDLTSRMQGQAERFGAKIVYDQITEVDFDGPPFTLTGRADTYTAAHGHRRHRRQSPAPGHPRRAGTLGTRRFRLRHLRRRVLQRPARGRGWRR